VDFKEKKAQNEGATFDFFAESEESGTDQVRGAGAYCIHVLGCSKILIHVVPFRMH